MLKAVAKGWFFSDFTVQKNDIHVAEVKFSLFLSKVDVILAAERYMIDSESFWGGDLLLKDNSSVLARAKGSGLMSPSINIEYADRHYTLVPESQVTRKRRVGGVPERVVVFQDEFEIGYILPEGSVIRVVIINLPEAISLPAQIFFLLTSKGFWTGSYDGSH